MFLGSLRWIMGRHIAVTSNPGMNKVMLLRLDAGAASSCLVRDFVRLRSALGLPVVSALVQHQMR